MTTVFIAGSIKIKNLHPRFINRITNIVNEDMNIVVGDANGADSSIQMELSRQQAKNVTVYCTGEGPRNNFGDWPVNRVYTSEKPGTRAFFTAKDISMASVADYGLMLWDTASTGTLSNVFQLLKNGKKSSVFIHKKEKFINVKTKDDISELVSEMSDRAKLQAERKIGLSHTVRSLVNEQRSFSFT